MCFESLHFLCCALDLTPPSRAVVAVVVVVVTVVSAGASSPPATGGGDVLHDALSKRLLKILLGEPRATSRHAREPSLINLQQKLQYCL